ncbi:MAG: redox-regulated ATPase YchF [Methylacidiphilales bacterium]|nr:redox-regulated ATPase YchF [Candidatus Methylacidiphilales bacterium]MDW8349868.1 redox-regulated ATPase YchF [Verrucomicrobiae bacterium]
MLRAGIVGLPNVGKSTLFNALTRSRKAQAANYPFCTIDPNTGIVTVPDPRLQKLSALSRSAKTTPAIIEIVDIAGLVRGASQGEGLGNQFLSHIREVDAIVHVVRCFTDDNIHHVSGNIDPIRDIETITTELILADLASVQKRIERNQKKYRSGDPEAKAEQPLLEKLLAHLNQGLPAITLPLSHEEKNIIKNLFLLTAKPTLFACNVAESDLAQADHNPHVQAVKNHVRHSHQASTVVISAQIESDLIDLPEEEQRDYLAALGVPESGCGNLIRSIYTLLGLRTYFTTGEKETRAWTIHAGDKAPRAAGVIHSDFERGFIAAETVHYDDLISCGSFAKAREAGKLRIEGKDYIVQDGDVIEFRFNV